MQRGTERRDQGRRGNGGSGDGQMGDMARSMAVMQEVLKRRFFAMTDGCQLLRLQKIMI